MDGLDDVRDDLTMPLQFFEGVTPPARTCVGVAQLPKNAIVELELVAEIPQ